MNSLQGETEFKINSAVYPAKWTANAHVSLLEMINVCPNALFCRLINAYQKSVCECKDLPADLHLSNTMTALTGAISMVEAASLLYVMAFECNSMVVFDEMQNNVFIEGVKPGKIGENGEECRTYPLIALDLAVFAISLNDGKKKP